MNNQFCFVCTCNLVLQPQRKAKLQWFFPMLKDTWLPKMEVMRLDSSTYESYMAVFFSGLISIAHNELMCRHWVDEVILGKSIFILPANPILKKYYVVLDFNGVLLRTSSLIHKLVQRNIQKYTPLLCCCFMNLLQAGKKISLSNGFFDYTGIDLLCHTNLSITICQEHCKASKNMELLKMYTPI